MKDVSKEIFRRQQDIVGHVPSSESKGCCVRSLNERVAGWRSYVYECVYMYTLTDESSSVYTYG